MKKVEIGLVIILFCFSIVNIWIQDDEATFAIFSTIFSTFSLTYLFGGFYLIKPNKSKNVWKLGSIITGVFVSIAFFMLIGKMSKQNISITVFLLLLLPLFICIVILSIKTFLIKSDKSKSLYFRKVFYKVSVIFTIVLLIAVQPGELVVRFLFGSNSETYFRTLQNRYYDEANQLRYHGNVYEAKNKIEIALSYFEQQNDRSSAFYQQCICELGRVLLEQGEYRKADSIFNIVLRLYKLDNPGDIKEKYNNEYQKAYYTAIYNSSGVETSIGNLNKSDSLLSIALDYYNENLPLAYIYHGFAINEIKRYKFNSADSLLSLSLEYHKKSRSLDSRKYISTLQELAILKMKTSDFHIADSILNVCESYTRMVSGVSNKTYASIMDLYLQLNMELADYNKAKKYCFRSMKIKEGIFGKTNTEYLQSILDLSNIYIATSKFQLADSILKHVKPTIEFNFDNRSPIACRFYDNFCLCYEARMFYEEAEEYAIKSVYGRQYWYGAYSLSTAKSYNNLASVLYHQADFLTADTLYLLSLNLISEYVGRENMSYISSLNGYSLVLIERDSLEIASNCLEYCQEICQMKQGLNHPDYATILLNKAYLKTKQRNYLDARELYNNALTIFKRALDENNISIAKTYYELGNFEILNNNTKAAITNYEESIKIYKEIFGPDHFFVLYLNDQVNILKEPIITESNDINL